MDLKKLIRDQLLLRYAKSLQGDVYLLYGNTMDSITMQTVHSMVNLDGYSLSTICNPSTLYTYPDSQVHVGSALGELTTREIVLYCHYKNLQYQPGVSLFLRPEPSVYHLIMGAAEGSWVMRRSRGIATGRLRLHAAHCDRNGGEAEANDGHDSMQALWEVGVWGESKRQIKSEMLKKRTFAFIGVILLSRSCICVSCFYYILFCVVCNRFSYIVTIFNHCNGFVTV